YLFHLDHPHPLPVAAIGVNQATAEELCWGGRRHIAMVAEVLSLDSLPGSPVLQRGMRRLVFGGEHQSYIKLSSKVSRGHHLPDSKVVSLQYSHGARDVAQRRLRNLGAGRPRR